jgi:two-component system LytT family sensor kinase
MTTMTESDLDHTFEPSNRLALSRRELAMIGACWAAYAVLSIASRLLDRAGVGTAQLSGIATVALTEAFCWAILTPPIFILAGRLDGGRRRATQIIVAALIGIAIAVALGWLGTELRRAFTPFRGPAPSLPVAGGPTMPSALPGGARVGVPRGPPIWFGILNALVLYLGVLAAGLARTYSRRYQLRRVQAARREARLEAQLAEARLDALRRQLDPHFLFNTLNTVSALLERDPRGVRRMIMRLSELLRHSFEGGGEPEVALRAELALLTRYVEIMQVRFQGRLAVETRVDEHVLDALVPSMILQPLVENAIKHGVEQMTGSGVGRIEIEAELDGDRLFLRVRDNGPGAGDALDGARREGVGLRNTMERLEQLYGTEQRFSLLAAPGGGTVAEIMLPYHVRAAVSGARSPEQNHHATSTDLLTSRSARVD